MPTILPVQSVLFYPQYEVWGYTPKASDENNETPPQWRTEDNFSRRLPDAVVATTEALETSTYAAGVDGVGSTITKSGNGALPAINGLDLFVGDALFVKDEPDDARNGLYVVTSLGSAGTPWVLTRHTSMDTSAEFVGHVFVQFGENKGTWLCPPRMIEVGSTPVRFERWPNLWRGTVPPGMTLNITNGRIEGAATVAGPGYITLQFSNDNGETWSDPVNSFFAIDPRPLPLQAAATIDIDLATRQVQSVDALSSLVFGDDLFVALRFIRNGVAVDLGALQSLQFGLREDDEDELTVLGGGHVDDDKSPPHFGRVGSGLSATYLLYSPLNDQKLKDAVENMSTAAAGERPWADLDAEIEWMETNLSGVGPETLRRTTVPFRIRVYLDIIP